MRGVLILLAAGLALSSPMDLLAGQGSGYQGSDPAMSIVIDPATNSIRVPDPLRVAGAPPQTIPGEIVGSARIPFYVIEAGADLGQGLFMCGVMSEDAYERIYPEKLPFIYGVGRRFIETQGGRVGFSLFCQAADDASNTLYDKLIVSRFKEGQEESNFSLFPIAIEDARWSYVVVVEVDPGQLHLLYIAD